jgi:hypothetical protein
MMISTSRKFSLNSVSVRFPLSRRLPLQVLRLLRLRRLGGGGWIL